MMKSVVSLGSKSQSKIFVEKGDTTFVVPFWISKKGNLCWKIHETLYVKLRNGFVMMLEDGEWVPADARTKATVNTAEALMEA